MNPAQSYLDDRARRAAERKDMDRYHWEQWKAAPEERKPEMLKPLLASYAPTFRQKVQQWKPPAIPESAMLANVQGHFVNALHDWNPDKGALSTHFETRAKKALRFVGKHQNIGYIPEGQTQHIGKIQRARDALKEEIGRDPTPDEIGDYLGMPPKRVTTIMTAMKKDLPSSLWETDPVAQSSSREQQVLGLLPYELTPNERRVFDHIYGLNGAPKIESNSELARALGMKQESQVSRLKSSIIAKFNKFK